MSWLKRLMGGGRTDDGGRRGVDAGAVPAPPPLAGLDLPELRLLGTTPSGKRVLAFAAGPDELLPWWERLRDAHPSTGHWPVLVDEHIAELCAALPNSIRRRYDDDAEVARTSSLTRQDLLDVRAARFAALGGDDDEFEYGADENSRVPERLDASSAAFRALSTTGLVALVPADHGWQVPAVLGYLGGLNYGMEPIDHVVTLHDWHDRFGAQLVSLTNGQVLELLVERPPTDPAEALEVAREHYEYCIDAVDAEEDDLTTLAQQQVGSYSWYFWWD